MFKSAKRKLWLLIIFLITITPLAYAGKISGTNSLIVTPSATPAIIGSTVNIVVTFSSDEANTKAQVLLAGMMNTALQNLSTTNQGGTDYIAQGTFTIQEGSLNNVSAPITLYLSNASGSTEITGAANIQVDNKRPLRDGIITAEITRNGNPVTGNSVQAGDQIIFTQKTVDDDTASVVLNMTSFNVPSQTSLALDPESGNKTWKNNTPFIVPTITGNNFQIPVTITDNSGQNVTYSDFRLTVGTIDDGEAPVIDESTIALTPDPSDGTTVLLTGNQVIVYFEFTSTVNPTNGRINYNNILTTLNFTNLQDNKYSATGNFTILPGQKNYTGTRDNDQVTIQVTNANGTGTVTKLITVDNKKPSRNGNMTVVSITRNGTPITGGLNIIKPNDVVKVSQKITDDDTDTVTMDLSAFGLSSVEPMDAVAGDAFTYEKEFTIPDPLPAGNLVIGLTITDKSGQTETYANALSLTGMENGALAAVTVTSNAGAGNVSKAGNQLKFEASVSNYDNHTVTVNCSELKNNHGSHASQFDSFPITLTFQGKDGSNTASFQSTMTLPTDQDCYYNGLSFEFKVIDKDGTTVTTTQAFSFTDTIDLGDFQHRNSTVEVYTANGDLASPQVATAASTLKFISDVTATAGPGAESTVTVTVDLTPIGEAALTLVYDSVSNKYIGTYNGGFGNIQLDGKYVTFNVTATDRYGNTISKSTTPAIMIDNVNPVINDFTITGATGTGGIIKYKDRIVFKATIDGANNGTAFVDLTNLDGSGILNLTHSSGSNWQQRHTVDLGSVDDDFEFILIVKDASGNQVSSSVTMNVDNEPPEYVSQNTNNNTQLNPPFMIIGDNITVSLTLDKVDDNPSVKIDLSKLGNYGIEDMDKSGNTYTYTFDIATGPINHGATFPVNIIDDAGNTLIDNTGKDFVASYGMPLLDQNPPDPQIPTITIKNRASGNDNFPNSINSWKTVTFKLPFTREAGYEDSATATVNIYPLNKATQDSKGNPISYLDTNNLYHDINSVPTDYAVMTKNGTIYTLEIVATESFDLEPQTNYRFEVIMTDKSGNMVSQLCQAVQKIDLEPPVISNVTVTPNNPGTVLAIGDTLTFTAQVSGNDGSTPKIELSSIDPTLGNELMKYDGPGFYSYTIKIATGTLTGDTTASCCITVYDGIDNFAVSYTPEVTIDNKPPEINSFNVTSTSISSYKRINYSDLVNVDFEINSKEDLSEISLDITCVGHENLVLKTDMTETGVAPNISYTYSVQPELYNASYTNYQFEATIADIHGNRLPIVSNTKINIVDCQVPSFVSSLCGAEISDRNAELPAPTNTNVARIGDTITIYASMTAAVDATAKAVLEISPGAASITRTMDYNAAKDRHEASFVVDEANTNSWASFNGSILYELQATDMAANIATPATNLTSFIVENVRPHLASYSIYIEPDYLPIGIFNIASGTNSSSRDLLVASATLTDNAAIAMAQLDLSNFGGPADYVISSISGSVVSNEGNGVDLTAYNQMDYTEDTVTLTVWDQAGYKNQANTILKLDNKSPEITGAMYDGEMLKVSFSETPLAVSNLTSTNRGNWHILASSSANAGTTYRLSLATATWNDLFDDYEITLSSDTRRVLTNSASSSIYLEAIPNSYFATTDLYNNWLGSYTAYPIEITNYTWREDPAILSFNMVHDWPNSVKFIIEFTQIMSPRSFVASQGVIFIDAEGISTFNDVSYDSWYVFQKDDTYEWSNNNKTLTITLSQSGRDWIAFNLGDDTSIKLKFAQYYGKRMISNEFDKQLKQYTIASPFVITDNRSTSALPALNVLSSPKPTINLASATLTLTFNDRVKLFTNNFGTENETDPKMAMPTLTDNKGATSHLNNISLFNINNDQSVQLTCKAISTEYNTDFASKTVVIQLTDSDIEKILNFYNTTATINWGLQVNAEAFENLWGTYNTKYKPTVPGAVTVIQATPTENASVIAVSVSDMPPTKDDNGNFTIDFELNKSKAGVIELPFSMVSSPTVAIEDISGNHVADAELVSWSTRTVKNKERTIATFKTVEDFQRAVDGEDAQLTIYNLKDIFGNINPSQTVTFVYNRNDRSSTATTGFSTASEAFVIDNVAPTVVSVSPILLGITDSGKDMFTVDYSEKMLQATTPSLSMKQNDAVINFTFKRWEASGTRAVFANNQSITENTPNGTWQYVVSGGEDLANNALETTEFDVTVKSAIPRIVAGSPKLYTIRDNISDSIVVENKPFNFEASPNYIKLCFEYQNAATENLPHTVYFYDENRNMIGSATVSQFGVQATATLDISNFDTTLIPTANKSIFATVCDIAGNETSYITSLDYYGKMPVVSAMTITDAATYTNGIYYYRSDMEKPMTFTGTMSTSKGALHVLVASYSVPMSPMATASYDVGNGPGMTFTFGKELGEAIYMIQVADEAGNLATGMAPLVLNLDNTRPSVASTIPGPADMVANTPAGMATFSVYFSEPMDVTIKPLMELATNTKSIKMNFVGWSDNMMVASFTNVNDLDSTYPVGIYNYIVNNAKDLAGNEITVTPATMTTDVQPKGPGVNKLEIFTIQSDISDKVLVNHSYNPVKYDDGTDSASVTFQLSYISGPFNTPHSLLVYDKNDNNIATLTVTAANPGVAVWAAGDIPATNAVYSFRVIDNLANFGPDSGYLDQQFTVDITTPSVSKITFDDKNLGKVVDGIKYFSPVAGLATITVTTTAKNDMQILAYSATATKTYDITATDSYSMIFGSDFTSGADDDYTIRVANSAGNISYDVSASLTIRIDTIPPQANPAFAIDDTDNPISRVGKEFTVLVSFDSDMNQDYKPTVAIATDTGLGTTEIATLTFKQWDDARICRFTANGVFDTMEFPTGTSSITISDARDLAGNLVASGIYGEVEIISTSPKFYATLTSQQSIVNNDELINKPFSPTVAPTVATLSITYTKGPFALDHILSVYDGTGTQVATHTLTSGATSISVNNKFFSDPDNPIITSDNYQGSFTVRLTDVMGNISGNASSSETIPFEIIYDGIAPKVTSFNVTGVSSASTQLKYYYNPAITGSLTADINLSSAENIRLISSANFTATRTYDMQHTNTTTYTYKGDLSDIYSTPLPDGDYTIMAVDDAGNLAVIDGMTTTPAQCRIIIDTTAPTVLNATMTASTYISSGNAGMATFSIQFSETMFEAAEQYLEIATDGYKIPCELVRFDTTAEASDTAIFQTAISIPTDILQGSYVYRITGTDLAGNVVNTDFGEVLVKSSGPLVSSMVAYSYQSTVASETLDSGNEMLIDELLSFNVEPKAATLTITLSEKPDGDASLIYVNFIRNVVKNNQKIEEIAASYPVALDTNLTATFTWDASTAPIVATSASYLIRIADSNYDLSAKSYTWNVDNEAPVYKTMLFNDGVDFPGSGTVYLNPYRHTDFKVNFKGLSDNTPKLRVRNGISTDTYALASLGSNAWETAFRGKYSRPVSNPDVLMPDGVYDIGLVDQAGNVAVASGSENLYKLVIDTKAPEISSYTLTMNGVEVKDNCAPSPSKPLTIEIATTEPLIATGVFYIDIFNAGETRINRLNLVNDGGKLKAVWNGRNSSGETASDGKYTFRASDICGNVSTTVASISAITADFMIMGDAAQTGSNTVKIWFNQPIATGSLNTGTITSKPALSISNIHITDGRALTFNTGNMTHGASYTISISTGLTNIYGTALSASSTKAIFTADTKGPSIVGCTFDKVNSQSEVMLVFDQEVDKTTAEATGSYQITDSTGNSVPIVKAILQPDNTSVMLYTSGTFIENASYKVKATGVKDSLGNNACESSIKGFGFRGRDITPPVFTISAFSNAANENDIIVVAVSNEDLKNVPTLLIKHGTSSVTKTMQQNSGNKRAFMATASLKASNGGSGDLIVTGEDNSGNVGSSNGYFIIATVNAKASARLSSNDRMFSLTFDENSLKKNATVKILQRNLIKDETASGTLNTALQNEYASFRGARAAVTATKEEADTNAELVPLTDAYEATIATNKINKGMIAALKVPETASNSQGIGLFYQKNGTWCFASAAINSERQIRAKISTSHVFAILRDTNAPTIKLDESIDLSEAFTSARPEFRGSIRDFGSGIDASTLEAKFDNQSQPIKVDDDGNFNIKPLSELTNGNHNLEIVAKDRTGNNTTTGSMRFALTLPFEFKQIIQYPNPARNNCTIRIRTNSTGVNCGIRIKIYDVAGHKVADFDEGDVRDRGDGNYEVRWDLRNQKGKKVANGVYIAKIEAINPENGSKVKQTLKIAVLK